MVLVFESQEDLKSQEDREKVPKHELDITTDEVKELQALDPTLSEVRQTAKAAKFDREKVPKHELDITTDEVKELQALDPTLSEVRQTAKAAKFDDSEEEIGLFYRDDLLFKRWIPTRFQKMDREGRRSMAVEQLVLPRKCRRKKRGPRECR